MRRLRYNVAMSLDGFIARPNGAYDWIVEDSSIDFGALMREFDTLVMGRRTYEVVRTQGKANPFGRKKLVVASRTLKADDVPGVTVVARGIDAHVAALKREPGKDIWLFGGGDVFRQLLDARLVDTVEVAVMPVLIGAGIPVLPPGADSPRLQLTSSKALPSGIVMLAYRVTNI
jgi:dihydrofolate reductase